MEKCWAAAAAVVEVNLLNWCRPVFCDMSCQERVKRRISKLGSSVVKHLGHAIRVIWAALCESGLILPKATLPFITKCLLPTFQLCDTILAWYSLIQEHVMCTDVSFSCQSLLLLQASAVIHQWFPGHTLIYFTLILYLWYHSTWRNKLALLCSVFCLYILQKKIT